MCTLTVAWGVFEDEPLVVAANRDEVLARPSTGPGRSEGELTAVAPRDGEAGGTWIGYNERGLFAGVTNRWTDSEDERSEPSDRASGAGEPASRESEHSELSDGASGDDGAASREGGRSRGLLVRDVLDQPTTRRAAALVEREVERREYAGFNMLVADGFAGDPPEGFGSSKTGSVGTLDAAGDPAAVYLEYDGALRTRTLESGVHVVVNVGADGEYVSPPGRADAARRQAANADRLRAHLRPEPGESAREWRERARAALRDHEFGVCVHDDGFGTRSSSVLSFGEDGVSYEYADGPPCETDFERVETSVRGRP
ncbi:hypothetical protein BRD13_07755 [Halobacteriales archaeon SW_5_70_135]|nr:MAG: hypothetical protein BRD13_07755 [Halobacteriales archaeon SW_5_70_135]